MKKRPIISAVLSIFLTSCSSSSVAPYSESKLATESIDWYASQVKQKKNFKLCDSGAAIGDDIEKLYVGIECRESLNATEARSFFLDAVQEFVAYVNVDKEIRPFLHHFPFQVEDLVFSVEFKTSRRRYALPPCVAKMTLEEGVLRYYSYDSRTGLFEEFHDEPYDQVK